MWNQIKPVLAEILKSKKALALLAAVIVWTLAQAGVILSPDAVMPLLGVAASYIVGQGLADIGKEKVKEEVKAVTASKADPGKPSA